MMLGGGPKPPPPSICPPPGCCAGAIDAMTFKAPVHVGDEVSCYCKVHRIGTTSITIHVESWARSRLGELDAHMVTEGKFTYVAIDEDRKPIPVIRDKK